MEGVIVLAALTSAFLHAAWNAAVRLRPDPRGALVAQVIGAGALAALLMPFATPPGPAAIAWLAASTFFNVLSMFAMLRAYAAGGEFGLVYPLIRAISPLLVALFADLVAGEMLGPYGLTGVGLIAAGVAFFASGDIGNRKALFWALTAGALGAVYVVCDAQGARASGSPIGYGLVLSLLNAIVFAAVYRARGGTPIGQAIRDNWSIATIAPFASMASYLLILWVYSKAPIAVGAALRDTSVVFGALIAAIVLKERVTKPWVVGVALAAAGAMTLRFA